MLRGNGLSPETALSPSWLPEAFQEIQKIFSKASTLLVYLEWNGFLYALNRLMEVLPIDDVPFLEGVAIRLALFSKGYTHERYGMTSADALQVNSLEDVAQMVLQEVDRRKVRGSIYFETTIARYTFSTKTQMISFICYLDGKDSLGHLFDETVTQEMRTLASHLGATISRNDEEFVACVRARRA